MTNSPDHTNALDENPYRRHAAIALLCAAVLVFLVNFSVDGTLSRIPDAWVLPYSNWLQNLFDFIRGDDERFGLIHITRSLSTMLEWLLNTTSNLLYGRNRWPHIGPIPWSAIVFICAVTSYWLGGHRIALLVLFSLLWIVLVGQWKLSMQTMSVIIVASPLSALLGLLLGIAAWKHPTVERALKPILAILQTIPFFTYLLPAVIFFKVGPTAGAVATIAFAIPPMILMTTLGLKNVSDDIVEAGKMAGCSRRQMLWRVYVPAARREILIGVNQVIMLSLAMVVLTAFIGMPGLGAKLLSLMNSLKLGRSFEIGVTIVLIAICLDRCSKAWVTKQPVHFERDTPWWRQHQFLVLGVSGFALFCILGAIFPLLTKFPRALEMSMNKPIDSAIHWVLDLGPIKATTEWLRWFLITWVFIPLRNSLLAIPSYSLILVVAALGFWTGGLRSAIFSAGCFLIVALTGWWDRAMITLYAVLTAVVLATLIGIPIGIWASRTPKASKNILLACDTAQTFPSFIYLIPAIMLFGVNDVAVIFAILIFATVPIIRYTVEGLTSVSEETIESAEMSGASLRQKLLFVQLPLALPTMAIGFNQAIMFSFFMVIIAAFIGTQGLGQELQRTLAGNQLGKNFVLGMCVSLMALSLDNIIMRWASKRKKTLGIE